MLTADGVPILMHDETLERTTRCRGCVAEQTLTQIRACDAGVPTLAEAMAVCEHHKLWTNIELKPSSGLEEETGTVVGVWLAQYWNGQGVISSFSEKSALAARRHLPDEHFALLYEALPADWQASRARLGAVVVHLDAAQVDHAVTEALAGLPWACYTVNDRTAADQLFASGCAAVFTDRPDLLLPAFA